MPRAHPCISCLAPAIQRGAQSVVLLVSLACVSPGGESGGSSDSVVARPQAAAAKAVKASPVDTLWLLAPDSTGDAVHSTDTEESLIARYGAANVTREHVDQGEGMLVPGTVLFGRDTLRRLEVQWGDTVAYSQPLIVTAVGSSWMVAPGIGFGTTLRRLEELNGGPFELRGFRGHYAGKVSSWGGGRLAPFDSVSDGGYARVKLHLQPATPYPPGADTRPYSAENLYPSSDAGIQLLNPRVVWMEVHPR